MVCDPELWTPLILGLGLLLSACPQSRSEPESISKVPLNPPVSGSLVLVARLIELPGDFPPNDHYDYAYILKYRVEKVFGGDYDGDFLLVGHYNPRQARQGMQGRFGDKVGGNLRDFRAGDLHYLVLNPLAEVYAEAIEDEYYLESLPRYWASWADLYIPPAGEADIIPATVGTPPRGR